MIYPTVNHLAAVVSPPLPEELAGVIEVVYRQDSRYWHQGWKVLRVEKELAVEGVSSKGIYPCAARPGSEGAKPKNPSQSDGLVSVSEEEKDLGRLRSARSHKERGVAEGAERVGG